MPTQSPPREALSAPLWSALSAVALLTVVPVPGRAHRPPSAVAVACFGGVGLALGGLLAAAEAGLAPLLAAPVRSALLLCLLAALSGALHLDGLMDSADGLFAGRDREQRLAIMRDSRAGAFGVVAAVAVLLLEWSALTALGGARLQALVIAVGVSRAATGVALAGRPARADGLASAHAVPRRGAAAAAGMLATATAAVALGGWRGGLAAAAAVLAAAGVGLLFERRVGGITGDGCGAAGELALATALVVLGARS